MTRMTRYTCAPLVRLAQLTVLVIACLGDRRNPFHHVKSLCVAEFDLWSPDCARNMNPIVVSCSFKRLAWEEGSSFLPLILAVFFGILGAKVSLLPFFLTVAFCFLFV